MNVATIEQLKYRVEHAAARYGKTASRIRQICIQYEIGFKFSDKAERRLTEADMMKIGEILEETGRTRDS